ncbi:hypothetical protein [Herbiconiux sp. UC225_62]|uniref:hypothetical protein n=1 Tax=Herbiconiux sp. UC225_62 TaxID=3350168 RepID=UPI0036D2321D
MTNPESRSDETSARTERLVGSSTPLTRRQLREAALEREARNAPAVRPAESRPMSRRERIAAEAAAATAAMPSAEAVAEPVPVVTTEIVIVPVAEPAPLTRRQLRDREQQLRAREAELQLEEIADLEIAALDSGALEPALELALEPVVPESSVDELPVTEPALHLARPGRRDRRRASESAVAASEVVEAELLEAELIGAPEAGPAAATASAQLSGAALTGSSSHSGGASAASASDSGASASHPTARIASMFGATSAATFASAADAAPAHATATSSSGASVEPFVARSASLALSAPASPSDLAAADAAAGGTRAAASRGSRSRRRSGAGRPPREPRAGRGRGGWAKAGLTAVAMTFVLGITAVTAIPSTVSASPVDANVVNLSLTAGTAPAPQQLITAGSASEVVNRDGYGVTDAGELQAAGYSTAQLLVGRSLAQELVNAVDSGKLVGSTPDHIKEIRWIAQGVTVPDCGVDYRVLEIIAIAVRNFDQVGVSDINRKCTGQIEGAGTSSSHYVDGGGHAVDFYLLNNKSLDGTDAGTLKLISLLDPVMPVGAHVGQAQCRASAGIKLQLTNWTEFDDSCTHMHVDVPVTDAPLLLTDDSLLASQ